ncbi:MAG TPA: histidine triad nucleotide-binding protein [Anaerolineales bacterium]
MDSCLFCKIVSGEAPSQTLFRDEQVTAFRDIHPAAPSHVLIVPNRHIASVNDLLPGDELLMGHLLTVARELAGKEGIDQSGYRLIVNTGPNAGQAVFHLHLHLLGGQKMRFPMG